ncbi:hypothetical protein C8C76_13041 [Halanaerobium saccharolyticum]|uniref:Uncharacterized protein n=1 Tax=Halanaerobium saccharolyticum TaxID=43595 RepID=A0A2T5RH71_9FIRM|nr:hypothetical protein [Halanaerobium saccharolyticum]PTV95051.1 hypothetical protein C8C76_13041 [Halanaerobium saccharolyticum]
MPKRYDPDECGVIYISIYLLKKEFLDSDMIKLSGDSVTDQEAKIKEKEE